jgi:hypothetical protein
MRNAAAAAAVQSNSGQKNLAVVNPDACVNRCDSVHGQERIHNLAKHIEASRRCVERIVRRRIAWAKDCRQPIPRILFDVATVVSDNT